MSSQGRREYPSRDPGESGEVTQPLSCLSNPQSLEDSIGKNRRRYPRLIAIYALFFYNDGALFSQISGAFGEWFADRITEDLQP
jgi:hypothetical protein